MVVWQEEEEQEKQEQPRKEPGQGYRTPLLRFGATDGGGGRRSEKE